MIINSYQIIISSDTVNTVGHAVDTLTGLLNNRLLIDWIYNFDIEFEWVCILGTEKLLWETQNIDTFKFEIRGVN